jgi:hypothetical protein
MPGLSLSDEGTLLFPGRIQPRDQPYLLPEMPLPCFYRGAGIYSIFALLRVAPSGGRKPTFLLPPDGLSFRPA